MRSFPAFPCTALPHKSLHRSYRHRPQGPGPIQPSPHFATVDEFGSWENVLGSCISIVPGSFFPGLLSCPHIRSEFEIIDCTAHCTRRQFGNREIREGWWGCPCCLVCRLRSSKAPLRGVFTKALWEDEQSDKDEASSPGCVAFLVPEFTI
jgi:hypothetical protein